MGHKTAKRLRKQVRTTLLRPIDIAWQAYQAAASLYGGAVTALAVSEDARHRAFMNHQFNEWWKRHPQTLPDGQLREGP